MGSPQGSVVISAVIVILFTSKFTVALLTSWVVGALALVREGGRVIWVGCGERTLSGMHVGDRALDPSSEDYLAW